MSTKDRDGLDRESVVEQENNDRVYLQSGNHGIGSMSDGVIKDNAQIIGKVDTQNNIVKIIKKPIAISIATLTTIVGTVGIIFAGEHRLKSDNISIGGDIKAPTTFGSHSPITIYEGDSPEVRQRKLKRVQELIAEEVYTNISNIDSRLDSVRSILIENEYGKALEQNNKLLPPSLQDYSKSKYRREKFDLDISSLRKMYDLAPVSQISKTYTQVLRDTNTNPKQVQPLNDSLTGVKNASQWLETVLSKAAKATPTDLKLVARHNDRINHAIARLNNNSEQSYVFGLILLDSLEIPLSEVQKNLSNLKYLEAPHSIQKAEIDRIFQEAKGLEKAEKDILKGQKAQFSIEKDRLAKSKKELAIKPSDTWNRVVAKAIALRRLGYISESRDAFSRYGEMFAKEDPTALQYSRTAQQFTIQLKKLDIDGGVYI